MNILSIDQGTTSSRAIVFDQSGHIVSSAQKEFKQHYPHDGWVEHDPEDIWRTTVDVCQQALEGKIDTVAAIGITNQRETTLIWDRHTGEPIYNAIVWQDRRTADFCNALKQAGNETLILDRTGLLIDAYFSASKIAWILDQVPGARRRAENGELAFGTVDSFLIWRLTQGKVHATDATNASRTQLFNIHTQQWDEELLRIFNIPPSLLPEVKDCADDYGLAGFTFNKTTIPINGVVGDQQGALVGQACFKSGMVKSTYGTGCFMIMNTGQSAVRSNNQLLTTVAYRLNGQVNYALEGSIFNAGTAIQWLRDGLKLFENTNQIDGLIAATKDNNDVYMVPAFTGLGAPHWDPNARGAILGLTRDTELTHLVRAALEAVSYQTLELINAMEADSGQQVSTLRVDGGMVANSWLLQFLADIISTAVEKPTVIETTALGAAYLAGLHQGIYGSIDDIASRWQSESIFQPSMTESNRQGLLQGWHNAINRIKTT